MKKIERSTNYFEEMQNVRSALAPPTTPASLVPDVQGPDSALSQAAGGVSSTGEIAGGVPSASTVQSTPSTLSPQQMSALSPQSTSSTSPPSTSKPKSTGGGINWGADILHGVEIAGGIGLLAVPGAGEFGAAAIAQGVAGTIGSKIDIDFEQRYVLGQLIKMAGEVSSEPNSFEHPAPNGLEDMSKILKDLTDKNIPFEDYQKARSIERYNPADKTPRITHHWNGVTHEEAIDALQKSLGDKDIGAWEYGQARGMGATHSELEEVHSLESSLHDYALARSTGASHSEVIEHIKSTRPYHLKGYETSPGDYGVMRASGATHAEAMQVPIEHQFSYGLARTSGATHDEVMHAISKGVNLHDYSHARDLNFSRFPTDYTINNWEFSPYQDMIPIAKEEASKRAMGIRPTGLSHDEAIKLHESGDLPFFKNAQLSEELDANSILNAEKTGLNIGKYVRGLSAAYQTKVRKLREDWRGNQKLREDWRGKPTSQESPKQEPIEEEATKESCETCNHYSSELAKHKETTEKDPTNANKTILDTLTRLKDTHMQSHTKISGVLEPSASDRSKAKQLKSLKKQHQKSRTAGIAEDTENWLSSSIKINPNHTHTRSEITFNYNGPQISAESNGVYKGPLLGHICETCPRIRDLQSQRKKIPTELEHAWHNEHCSCGEHSTNGHKCKNCDKNYYDRYKGYCPGCGSPFVDGKYDHGNPDYEPDESLSGDLAIADHMMNSPEIGSVWSHAHGYCEECCNPEMNPLQVVMPGTKTPQTTERLPENYCPNCGTHTGEGVSCPKCPLSTQCSCKGGSAY